MKIIKINSSKTANKSALLHAFLSVLICVIYTYVIMIFTDGEEFIGKDITRDVINGIRHKDVLVVCGILVGLVPIIFLRYTDIKFLALYYPSRVLYFLAIIFVYAYIFYCPSIFDLISFVTSSVPIGSFVGTVIAVLINQYKRRM